MSTPEPTPGRDNGRSRLLWALALFAFLLTVYMSNGHTAGNNDATGNVRLPLQILQHGRLTFTPEDSPFMFTWFLRQPDRVIPVRFRSWNQTFGGETPRDYQKKGFLGSPKPKYYLVQTREPDVYANTFGLGPGLLALPVLAVVKPFAARHGVLIESRWGAVVEATSWLAGMTEVVLMAMDQPQFLQDLIDLIDEWNRQRMMVSLDAGVDLFIRRGWYEGCDFVTPHFFRRAILPRLKKEVALAHERGAKFANIISSGTLPLLDCYLEAEVDVLIGIDPVQGTHTNMQIIKERVGHRICLWGGVSGSITVEMGTEDEVREAVREAMRVLGPTGFILSPVDNVREVTPVTWRNVDTFIDEWRRHW